MSIASECPGEGGDMFKNRIDGAIRIMMILSSLLPAFVSCAALTHKGAARDDAAITAAVEAKLTTYENLSSVATFDVYTSHGNVYLDGTIGSELERLRAADVVRTVGGVFK